MRPLNLEFWAVVIPTAFAVASLLVRTGMRRERVDNIKHGLTTELRNLREYLGQRLDGLEKGLADLGSQVTALRNLFFDSERRQGGFESTLEAHEHRLDQVERTILNGAGKRIAV